MEFIIGLLIGAVVVFCLVHKPTREAIGKYLQKQRDKKKADK